MLSRCGGSPASPTQTPPIPEAPGAPPPGAGEEAFRVAVLLAAAVAPSAADVARVFARADAILTMKTGERMTQVDLVSPGPGVPLVLARNYVTANAARPPDGTLVFSDDSTATSFGGYSQSFALPPPALNPFPSPHAGADKEYVAVVHFFHKYARCGYDNQGNRVSDRSFGGECRNRTGILCVDNGRYWTCPDTLNDLYADLDYFAGCTIVHEFMHPFGAEGAFDHYGTSQCTTRTGMSAADATNLRLAQQSCGMCPDVYGNFRRKR